MPERDFWIMFIKVPGKLNGARGKQVCDVVVHHQTGDVVRGFVWFAAEFGSIGAAKPLIENYESEKKCKRQSIDAPMAFRY